MSDEENVNPDVPVEPTPNVPAPEGEPVPA